MISQFTTRWQDRLNRPYYQYLLLTAVTLLAIILRFYKLGEWSLWIDEIFTINRAKIHVNLETLIAQWWHPSLSLILANGAIEALGVNAWSARLASALIGIISIPILYFPIKRWLGPTVALIAMLLLAVSPWHLEWSQNARYYTSQLLIYFLAAYTFFLAIERDRPRFLLLSGVLMALAIGERFTAVFLVPVVLVYLVSLVLLPIEKPIGFNGRNIALILVPGIGFGLVEIVRFLLTGSSYVTGAAELTYSLPIDDPLRLAIFIAYDIGVPLLCLAVFAGIYLLWQRSRIGLFVMINAIVPIGLLLLINPFYFTKDRYIFMVLPFWLILAAVGIQEIFVHINGDRRLLAIGVLALLLADAAGANLIYYQVNHGNRRDWKSAFALVQERSQPGDQYVTWWTEFGPYYLDQEIISWGDIDPEYVENSDKRFWFILDEETIWGNGVMKQWLERNGELVEILYQRRLSDSHLRIYLYDPN